MEAGAEDMSATFEDDVCTGFEVREIPCFWRGAMHPLSLFKCYCKCKLLCFALAGTVGRFNL